MNRILSRPLFVLFLLLSVPHTVLASEGPAWIYFILAPFALFSTPFFMTAVWGCEGCEGDALDFRRCY